jgi:hypothetical protein
MFMRYTCVRLHMHTHKSKHTAPFFLYKTCLPLFSHSVLVSRWKHSHWLMCNIWLLTSLLPCFSCLPVCVLVHTSWKSHSLRISKFDKPQMIEITFWFIFCLKNLHQAVVLTCKLQNTRVNSHQQKSIPSDISYFNLGSPEIITTDDFVIKILKLCYGCWQDLLPWGIFLTTTQFHIDLLASYLF